MKFIFLTLLIFCYANQNIRNGVLQAFDNKIRTTMMKYLERNGHDKSGPSRAAESFKMMRKAEQ